MHTDDEWITKTDRQDVEAAIMTNNSKRFHLASSTPLMQPAAVQGIGYLSNTPLADNILEGNFIPADQQDTYTQKFLTFIGKRPTLPTIPSTITIEDFQYYWKKSKEKTSSSMSGETFWPLQSSKQK